MERLSEKQFCTVTVLLHIILMLDVVFAVFDYPDFLLTTSILLITVYIIYMLLQFRRKLIPLKILNIYGCMTALQFLLFACGYTANVGVFTVLTVKTLGLGSSLALFFYGIGLTASCGLLFFINLVKYLIR